MDTIITLNTALPAPIDGAPPAWIQLTPAGVFRGRDGRGPYSVDAPAVVADSTVPFLIDENHATDLAQTSGAGSPARGWVVELQARDDGVWGRVDWTQAGSQMVAAREYRGISPALASDKNSGRVLRVLRASLTNLPNFEMATLHQQETGMDLDRLRAAVGLGATASFDDCMAAVTRATQAVSTHAADIARLARAAGAAETAGIAGIETVLAAARPAASEAQRMAQEIVSLNTQLATLTQNAARERATTVIDAAIKAGKPITALREHYITRHMASPADVDKELGAMVSLHAGGVGRQQAAQQGGVQMSDEEVEVAKRMGLTPEQIKAARDKRESQRGVH